MASRFPTAAESDPHLASPVIDARQERRLSRPERRSASVQSLAAHAPENTHPPLDDYYNALFTAFGPQQWWPAKTSFEVIVGAILTQNTAWTNVERAIANLRSAGLLSPAAIEKVPLRRLETLVRSSGYFRQKARKLKAFCTFLRAEYRGSLPRMFRTPTPELREKLLSVFGIGPETADSILLYAGGHGVFVVDAYTKRLLVRHGWAGEKTTYDQMRWIFERQFPGDARRFNEFHALIVTTGKNFCRTQQPLCGQCPLGRYLEEGR
ncbi:MAG: endonuclease III domain-containing protein [Acidobacteriia bacterium]|nr:endonuclease III domain-containing protein [Terriglobia bacterium]